MTLIDGIVRQLPPISLTELNATAQLLTRVDRKYFVPRLLLTQLITELDECRVLEIDGRRRFHYRTVYFDSPAFDFYRQHVQGRRHRHKVRTRTYTDSGECLLEVKSKGYRGCTVKRRIDHDPDRPDTLDPPGAAFVASCTGANPTRLHPVLDTVYQRTTLVQRDQRITLDVDLAFSAADAEHHGPDDVLVETKSMGGRASLDRMLIHAGVRPHTVSKYCVAAALLYPELTHNPWNRTLRRYFPADEAP